MKQMKAQLTLALASGTTFRSNISVYVHFFQTNRTVLADWLELFVLHFSEMAITIVMTILFVKVFPGTPTGNAAALDEHSVARNHCCFLVLLLFKKLLDTKNRHRVSLIYPFAFFKCFFFKNCWTPRIPKKGTGFQGRKSAQTSNDPNVFEPLGRSRGSRPATQ